MRQYKYLFIITFVISSFLFFDVVNADYKANVLNPSGAKCDLKDDSTGYCLYKDDKLNTYTSIVVWLDTGDEVTVLTDYAPVPTQDINLCSDYYVKVNYLYDSTGYTYDGYYCNANLTTNALTDDMKNEFTELGFPESYFEKLAILKTAHPNWEFKAINTKLDFNEAVKSLNIADRSLVQLSSSYNYAYLDTDSSSFDYYNNKYIPYDNITSNNAWYNANYDTIAYYLDPRNFLIDMYIFQFEKLSYENSLTDEELTSTLNEVFKNDYLSKYTTDFISAGKESKVSPVYLASLSKQEVGGSTTPNSAISGNVNGYEGFYNFYNIGAYSGDNPVLNGLSFAQGNDEINKRPWNTEYKAIVGGALWIYDNYLGYGQDTSYFKKWNVIHDYLIEKGEINNPYNNFTHQYMTNIMAPSSEAKTTYKSYYSTGILDSKFIFYIPIFDNMPNVTNLPTKTGWPNNYLSELIINEKKVPGFDGGITEYNYYLDINSKDIKIEAKTVSSKANVEGVGEFKIPEIKDNVSGETVNSGNLTYTVKVTAENGDKKEYKINIIFTGEKQEASIDVVTTLNNAGIKNNDKYLSGFDVGTDISFIKNKISNVNDKAKIELKDSVNNEKTTGKLATGDKVIVTVGDEVKEYEVVIYGDVNGDGKISPVDYAKVKNSVLGKITLSQSYKEAADVNKNGTTNPSDYAKIKNYVLGKTEITQ